MRWSSFGKETARHCQRLAVCQKAYGRPTGYNFPRKIIVALQESFLDQRLAEIYIVICIVQIGIFPI